VISKRDFGNDNPSLARDRVIINKEFQVIRAP